MSGPARRWLLVTAAATLLTLGAAVAPAALRKTRAFRVERVEVLGARYLTPAQAVAASGITATSTLFDDFQPWRAALERHPLVLRASIHRRLPDAVIFDVIESQPIALFGTRELRPIDARGRLLPIDPIAVKLDLPLVRSDARADSLGRVTNRDVLATLDVLRRIRDQQPWLASWTSELEPVRGGVRLRLRSPDGAEILVPRALQPQRLHELRLAIADLATRGSNRSGQRLDAARLSGLIRIDARFRDQIVVRVREAS